MTRRFGAKFTFPVGRITNDPEINKGHIEFHHVCIQQMSLANEGCSPLPDWSHKKQCIYAVDNMNNNLRIWRCLTIFKRIRCNRARPTEDTMRDALNLAHEFHEQPNLRVSDVRLTKLIDLKNITSR